MTLYLETNTKKYKYNTLHKDKIIGLFWNVASVDDAKIPKVKKTVLKYKNSFNASSDEHYPIITESEIPEKISWKNWVSNKCGIKYIKETDYHPAFVDPVITGVNLENIRLRKDEPINRVQLHDLPLNIRKMPEEMYENLQSLPVNTAEMSDIQEKNGVFSDKVNAINVPINEEDTIEYFDWPENYLDIQEEMSEFPDSTVDASENILNENVSYTENIENNNMINKNDFSSINKNQVCKNTIPTKSWSVWNRKRNKTRIEKILGNENITTHSIFVGFSPCSILFCKKYENIHLKFSFLIAWIFKIIHCFMDLIINIFSLFLNAEIIKYLIENISIMSLENIIEWFEDIIAEFIY